MAGTACALAGCGDSGEDYSNKPRPASPINVTAARNSVRYVNQRRTGESLASGSRETARATIRAIHRNTGSAMMIDAVDQRMLRLVKSY